MEIILLERIEKLGAIGDVVQVKDGFARNYLLPNKKALRANESNRKLFETNRGRIEEDNATRRTEAESSSTTIDGKTVQLIRQASNTGQLYGSVSARDIVEALDLDGAKVTKNQIVLDRPIKNIGVHEVKIALHPEVSVKVKVNVARSPEEAELQAQGVDVMSQMFERDDASFTEDYDPNAEPGATAETAAAEAAAGYDQSGDGTADADDLAKRDEATKPDDIAQADDSAQADGVAKSGGGEVPPA